MFLYEMHLHTYPTSGGGAPIEEHIPVLMERGYQGCVITNHFYNGDTRVHRALPWRDFVRPYIEDYERAKRFAEHLDFDVLFGIEVSTVVRNTGVVLAMCAVVGLLVVVIDYGLSALITWLVGLNL